MNIKLKVSAIFLLVVLAFVNNMNAQNYRVLQPERTSLYNAEYGPILGMRVDSVRVINSDTVYYLLKNLQQMDWNCFFIEGPSWMGNQVTIRPGGETVFYNSYQQPILIQTKAALNEEWLCFTSPELGFKAKIITAEIENVLGTPDSVKTISFQAIDSDGQNISHEVNNLNLKLSKNHGILKTINFYSFPELNLGFLLQWLSEFTLIGFDNPENGIQNLTWKAVNDHNIGDELHTVEVYSNITYSRRMETISLLLDKSVNGDTISYNWEKRIKVMINSNGNNTFTATIDTFLQKIYSNPEFDLLPGVAFEIYDSEEFTTTIMKEGFHGTIKAQLGGSGTVAPFWSDSCYNYVIFDNCFPDQDYYNGLGGPYYYEHFGFDECSNQLVYYKKDGIEWGTPIDFTVNSNLIPIEQKPGFVTIFPNPANDLVNIVFKGNSGEYRLQIVDNSGRKLAECSFEGETNTLDISNLKHSIYLLRFITDNQIFIRKLIKH